ncbi:MAG: hypothetical protein R2800_06310 [Flavipsychrobacter sp.]
MRYLYSILLLCCPFLLAAQGYTGGAVGSFDVYDIQSISITGLKGIVNFNDPSDYFGGQTVNNYAQVSIKSNNNWQVSVSTNSSKFTPLTTGASKDMPSTILQIRVNGKANFINMTINSQTLKTGNRGGIKKSGNEFNIDMKFDPGYKYNGGLYDIGLIYTLTRQ